MTQDAALPADIRSRFIFEIHTDGVSGLVLESYRFQGIAIRVAGFPFSGCRNRVSSLAGRLFG